MKTSLCLPLKSIVLYRSLTEVELTLKHSALEKRQHVSRDFCGQSNLIIIVAIYVSTDSYLSNDICNSKNNLQLTI